MVHNLQEIEKGIFEFKNYFKQILVPFIIYAGFECDLKSVERYEGSYSKKYQDNVPCLLLTKLFPLKMNLLSQQLLLEVKTQLIHLWKRFLKSLNTVKKE